MTPGLPEVVECDRCGETFLARASDELYLADDSGPYCKGCIDAMKCPWCEGTGEVRKYHGEYDIGTCPACKGTGKAQRED